VIHGVEVHVVAFVGADPAGPRSHRYRAECRDCGWAGHLQSTAAAAGAEADEHVLAFLDEQERT
jgi:hypothetical protein